MSKAKLLCLLLLCFFALMLGILFGFLGRNYFRHKTPAAIANTPTLIQQVQTLSQLVTIKYVLEKVILVEDVKWYGENRVLLVAHGVVKAGVDLARLEPKDLVVDQKMVRLDLPVPSITDVYLDEHQTQVLERTTGVMRTFDKDLEQSARRQAVDELKRAAWKSGILEEARERAIVQMRGLFLAIGYTNVEIRFNNNMPSQKRLIKTD